MKALIFSGGEFLALPEDIDTKEYSLIICADSGYLASKKTGVLPDVFIGDFDSVSKEEVEIKKIIELNPIKDKTDTQEAIDYAIAQGADFITILGALGKRFDHALANVHLLKYARSLGAITEIADVDTHITLVTDKAEISKKDGFCLSLLPLTDCTGVSVSGVYYPLENAEMPVGVPYGISNEFTENKAHISVDAGELLVILSKS